LPLLIVFRVPSYVSVLRGIMQKVAVKENTSGRGENIMGISVRTDLEKKRGRLKTVMGGGLARKSIEKQKKDQRAYRRGFPQTTT